MFALYQKRPGSNMLIIIIIIITTTIIIIIIIFRLYEHLNRLSVLLQWLKWAVLGCLIEMVALISGDVNQVLKCSPGLKHYK